MRVRAFEAKTSSSETKEISIDDGESWIATHMNGICMQLTWLI
jgi:hypothetical protein